MAKIAVYMITHNVTGRMYIGRSKKLEQRLRTHFSLLRNGKHSVEDMQKDYDDYGDDYTVTILSEDAPSGLEIKLMDEYHSTERSVGYNYKDPHVTTKARMEKRATVKTRMNKLLKGLTESQYLYAYTLLSGLFKE